MSVQSGAHLGYRPDPRKSLKYALVDLSLTRGEGKVNEIGFASEVGRVPEEVHDQALEAYTIEKLQRLAMTEHGEVKSSSCELLWIYSVDQGPQTIRQIAVDALSAPGCRCAKKPDGNIDCR